MTASLAGKTAIVTGAAGGIGFAAARRLAQDGAAVLLADVNETLGEAAAALTAQGHRARACVADLGTVTDAARLASAAIDAFGRIDVVVSVAGVHPYGTVVDTTPEVWDRVFAVNLRGAYLIAAAAIPEMRKQGGGTIVNVASVQALAVSTRVAAYAASKAGLLGLSRAIAIDHAADGIRCNAVCPGSVDTPMLRRAARDNGGEGREDEMIAGWGAMHPIGRVGAAEEIAAVISFLAGPQSSFVTGASFTVDGGVMAKLGIVLPERLQ